MGILNTSLTGLLTSQRALSVISHNIANVNTPGYNRQRVLLTTNEPQFTGVGYIGNGVEISRIERIQDQFLTTQIQNSISGKNEFNAFLDLAQRIDNTLGNEITGLSIGLQNFFNAVQDVVDLPSSIPARQAMISEAQSLTSRFSFLDTRLSELTSESGLQLSENIGSINSIARSLAELNERIVTAQGNIDQQPPNDLLDKRDLLIEQLAELVNVRATEDATGAVNVFIGNGQPLVLGDKASQLGATETYQGNYEITLVNQFNSITITDNITGGTLGGIVSFQGELLGDVRNSLGRIAISLAETFNNQHQLGQNLDGEVNTDFFNIGAPSVIPQGGAANNVSATITDASLLTNSDYVLSSVDGANNYILTRLSDGQATAIDTLGASPYTTVQIDGFTLTINAGAAAGEEYIIQPTLGGSMSISTAIVDPRKIAAAGPLRSSEATNGLGLPVNGGSAEISAVDISDLTNVPLTNPISLTFNSATNQFDISSPPGGTLAYNPATESAGKQFTIAAAGNVTFTISGIPETGDRFIIENNNNGTGDNRNALKLAELQTALTMLNGAATFQDAYGQILAEVGTKVHQAEISADALGSLADQSLQIREALSGVNLEEEAANLLKFQRQFQASAQLMTVADTLFQSLINAVQ